MDRKRRNLLRLIGPVLGLGLLAGCGFQPLHGTRGASGGLPAVEIGPIEEREGQILRSLLIDRLGDAHGRADYLLDATLTVSSSSLGIRRDEVATRAQVYVTVTYVLTDRDGLVLDDGNVRKIANLNLSASEFASDTSKDAAARRALTLAADELRIRITAALQKRQGG